MIDTMPPTARAIIEATAQEYEVSVQDIFGQWPRAPEHDAARVAAISRLSNEMIDGRYRYGVGQVAKWFSVSRPRVNAYRARASDYAPRITRK